MAHEDQDRTEGKYADKTPTKTGMIPFTPPGTELQCQTAYWLWGDLASQTPPLIIVHGGPGAPGRDWKVVTSLYEEHRIPVIFYDQVGCGDSTHLRDKKGDTSFWQLDLFVSELHNVVNSLHLHTFDLLGHSCGGHIVASFALTQPRGLRKLVIASSSPSERLRAQARALQRAQLAPEMQAILENCEEEGRMDASEYKHAQQLLAPYFCRLTPWPAELLEATTLLQEDDTVPQTMYSGKLLEPTGSMKDFDITHRLSEITTDTVPGGVLLTSGDWELGSDRAMEPFSSQIRARVEWARFPASAHFAHLEESQAYLSALSTFLSTN